MRCTPLVVLPALLLAAAPLVGTSPAAATSASPAAAAPALSWDFDGDGVRDLAAGQVGNEEGGPGQVLVRRASAAGVYTEPTVLQHPQAAEGNEAFGASLASADLDLDGYADLVVGAPHFYTDPHGYGSVTIFRGSPSGLTQAAATSVAWPRRPDGDLVGFGRSVVVGTLDGDRWPDLAVGAPDDDGDSGSDRSSVVVLRGGPQGFAAARSTVVPHPSGTRWFGEVLAVGDVDQDGHPDLVESGSYPDAGRHIGWLRGTATGPRTARVLSTGWAQSIAVGKVTGDRYPDVVASRPYARYDPTGKPYAGKGSVTLFRGSAAGPRAGVTVTQESRGVPGRSSYGDFFGASVTIADVNHNGRNEVVVGVPRRDVGAVKDAGAITVLRVGRTGFRHSGNRSLTQAGAGVPGTPTRFGNLGTQVATQDRSGDGIADLLVASRLPGPGPAVLNVLRVTGGPLGSVPGTSGRVLDGDLPRDASSS